MALNPLNSPSGWYNGITSSTSSTYTVSPSYPASLYLVDCMHCGEKFVTKPRKSLTCIQSLETCWDVECPKCTQEIRLCLHECSGDCEHVLDCLLVGISDKIIERALQLEFEKGAEVHRYEPYSPPSYYPWDPIIGNPNITYGSSTAVDYTISPYTITSGGTFTTGSTNPSNSTVTISFNDKLRNALQAQLSKDNKKETIE